MSNTLRFGLPLFLILVALTQWSLARARSRLTIEDKARVADATFQRWWFTAVFAVIIIIWAFSVQSVPRQWHWWWLVAFYIGVFVLLVTYTTIQWWALVRAGVAREYVRTQFTVFIVLDVAMLVFFTAVLYDIRAIIHH